MFIRVRDKSTGHEYDLPEGHRLLRLGLVEHVKPVRYQPSHLMRPAKHRTPSTPARGVAPEASAEGSTIIPTSSEEE